MRITFLDYLRFIACFMVMLVHSCEPFYLGGEGTFILNQTNGLWVTFIDSAVRSSVPLFVLASSYLLFPLKYDTRTFFVKRVKRVFVPFIIWALLYVLVPQYSTDAGPYVYGDVMESLKRLSLNFVAACGHLWFVYMLLGIYIVMPLLSPWAEKVSKKGEEAFLWLWLFTTTIPFWRLLAKSIYGQPQVWGECYWNEFGTFYGVSGFIGYVVLGHYIRTHVSDLSWSKTLSIALPVWAVGYAITSGWFWSVLPTSYPISDNIDLAVLAETSWNFTTTGVVLQTIGYFLVIRKFSSDGWFYQHVVLPVSKVSYGMYLMHIFILTFWFAELSPRIGSTPCTIFSVAVCTYITSFVCAKLLSYIPKVGKYIVG